MTPQEQDQAWGDILWALQYQRRWQLTDLSALVCNWRDRRCMCMLDQNMNDMYPLFVQHRSCGRTPQWLSSTPLLFNAGPGTVVHRNGCPALHCCSMQVLALSYAALVHSAR